MCEQLLHQQALFQKMSLDLTAGHKICEQQLHQEALPEKKRPHLATGHGETVDDDRHSLRETTTSCPDRAGTSSSNRKSPKDTKNNANYTPVNTKYPSFRSNFIKEFENGKSKHGTCGPNSK